MGLLSDIQEALTEAFDSDLSDVVASFVLTKRETGVYNSLTDSYDGEETTTDGRGVFSSFGANEIDGTNIKSEDEKLIVNGSDLSAIPNIDDVIRTGNGQEYIVINSTPVMGGGTTPIIYTIQIRKNVDKNG